MRTTIDRREVVTPEEGERKYGAVAFAHPTTTKPTPDSTRTNWRSIHHRENAYTFITSEDLEVIKNIISQAGDKTGINVKK